MESVARATKFATRVAAAGTRPDARLAFLTPAHVCARASPRASRSIFFRALDLERSGRCVRPTRARRSLCIFRRCPSPESDAEQRVAAGGGNQQYVTSLPKQVLARLARSLATFATMPEEFAQAHIVARGQQPPMDGRGALTRGRLLKILSDEVLAEWGGPDGAGADDDDEEEEEEKDGIGDSSSVSPRLNLRPARRPR